MSRTALLRGLSTAHRHALPAHSQVMTAMPISWEDRRATTTPTAAGLGSSPLAPTSALVRSFASYPTAETVSAMQKGNQFHEMDNDTITMLAAQGDVGELFVRRFECAGGLGMF